MPPSWYWVTEIVMSRSWLEGPATPEGLLSVIVPLLPRSQTPWAVPRMPLLEIQLLEKWPGAIAAEDEPVTPEAISGAAGLAFEVKRHSQESEGAEAARLVRGARVAVRSVISIASVRRKE